MIVDLSIVCPGDHKDQPVSTATAREKATTTIQHINRAWLHNRIDELVTMIHPEIVMEFPGFVTQTRGREAFLAGFVEFLQNSTVQQFRDYDYQVDVVATTAVVTFRYEMVFERSGQRTQAKGRDLWVLQYDNNEWVAVWRTMLETDESPA